METPILHKPIDYSEGLQVFCDTFMEVSTAYCPVDTGYLRSTLTADNDGISWAECYTDCEYAQYQEYGTWCMPAQPYFERAVEAAFEEATQYWQIAIDEAMEEEQDELQAMADAAEAEGDFEETVSLTYEGVAALFFLWVFSTIMWGIHEILKSAFGDEKKHNEMENIMKIGLQFYDIEIT